MRFSRCGSSVAFLVGANVKAMIRSRTAGRIAKLPADDLRLVLRGIKSCGALLILGSRTPILVRIRFKTKFVFEFDFASHQNLERRRTELGAHERKTESRTVQSSPVELLERRSAHTESRTELNSVLLCSWSAEVQAPRTPKSFKIFK